MAVLLTGAGGLFTRLGKVLDWVEDAEAFQTTNAAAIVSLSAEYDDASQDMLMAVKTRELAIQQATMASVLAQVRDIVTKTIIDMVNDDNPQPDRTLVTALRELIRQMRDSGDNINDNVCSIDPQVDGGANIGNGFVIRDAFFVAVYGDQGLVTEENQYLRTEDIILTCTADAQISGIEGREGFSVIGEQANGHPEDPAWPDGQGIGGSMQVSDPSDDQRTAVGRNLLRNSDFEDWTIANTPDGWSIEVGVAGTQVFQSADEYRGTSSLELRGDGGGTLTKLEQEISATGVVGQTAGKIIPGVRYGLYCQAKKSAGLVAGVVKISIKDAANNVLWSSQITISPGASYDDQIHLFTSGLNIKTGGTPIKCVIEVTTALTNAQSVFIDDLMILPLTQHGGPHGPYLNITPGSTPWKKGDWILMACDNTLASKFARLLDKVIGLNGMPLQLPFDNVGGESITDGLIA